MCPQHVRHEKPSICENEATLEIVEKVLYDLWSAANELARVRPQRERPRVTVFGSARAQPGQTVYEEVKRLTQRLAGKGYDIVTGGGPGLMQAANEGEQLGDTDGSTDSVGIRVELPFEQGVNPFVETVYTHRTFFTRLHHFVRISDAFVIVAGGIGTTLEMLMVWQLLQVGRLGEIPMILVGPMWRDLVGWARQHMIGGPFELASARDMEIPVCVDTIDEAAAIIEERLS
jgi:uncharacterized protein (TIGR00730 family)